MHRQCETMHRQRETMHRQRETMHGQCETMHRQRETMHRQCRTPHGVGVGAWTTITATSPRETHPCSGAARIPRPSRPRGCSGGRPPA
jgi:hypothetical protein